MLTWKRGSAPVQTEERPDAPVAGPTLWRRVAWLALPAFATVMLLATTNHVCQDVAVIPFLWVIPLALYLLTFIISFDHPRWYVRSAWAIPAMGALFLTSGLYELSWPGAWHPTYVTELAITFAAMFLVCMVCHGELARRKPAPRHLTEYYLLMSAGGALGGLATGLIAPLVFTTFMEWSLALLLGFALVTYVAFRGLVAMRAPVVRFRIGAAVAVATLLPLGIMGRWELSFAAAVERTRSFYGTLSVRERETDPEDTGGTALVYRSLYCNGTEHGRQFLAPALRREPLTYYGRETAVGQLLAGLKDKADARIGVIGMGVGTVACYGEKGQTYRFYEINPDVVRVARQHFTFIDDLQTRGARYELALGDARLALEHEPDQHFDALVLDAFSGDSIPVHLLTKEAFALYRRHLQPHGVIAVHITNHYLNLAPVVERVAAELGYESTRLCIDPKGAAGHYQPDYLLLSKDQAFIRSHPPVPPKYARSIPDIALWTDHAHNLFQILEAR